MSAHALGSHSVLGDSNEALDLECVGSISSEDRIDDFLIEDWLQRGIISSDLEIAYPEQSHGIPLDCVAIVDGDDDEAITDWIKHGVLPGPETAYTEQSHEIPLDCVAFVGILPVLSFPKIPIAEGNTSLYLDTSLIRGTLAAEMQTENLVAARDVESLDDRQSHVDSLEASPPQTQVSKSHPTEPADDDIEGAFLGLEKLIDQIDNPPDSFDTISRRWVDMLEIWSNMDLDYHELTAMGYDSSRLDLLRGSLHRQRYGPGSEFWNASSRTLNSLRNSNWQDREDFMRFEIIDNSANLAHCSQRLKRNPVFCALAIYGDVSAYKYVPTSLQRDSIILEAVISSAISDQRLSRMASRFKSPGQDASAINRALTRDPLMLQYLSPGDQENRSSVQDAVARNGLALAFASMRLRDDPGIVEKAIQQNARALEFASDSNRKNKRLVMIAIEGDPMALQFASYELRGDRSLVKKAVEMNPMAIQYASYELKGERSLVEKAMKANPMAIKDAPYELRGDRSFMEKAMEVDPMAIQHASYELQGDRSLVVKAMEADPTAIQYASYELRGDRSLVEKAMEANPTAIRYASYELRGDRSFVEKAMEANPTAIRYASYELRGDRSIVEKAMQVNPMALTSVRLIQLAARALVHGEGDER